MSYDCESIGYSEFVLGSEKTDFETSATNLNVWCTTRLCSETYLISETKQRMMFAVTSNSSVGFSYENLFEHSFMKILHSPPEVLETQQLVVVTTTYGYPPRYALDWINEQPWPVFISTKEKNFGISSEPWGNVGQEIASYVRFILLFWDHLPLRAAFVHGHEKTWHQEGYKMSYMLRNVCLTKYKYISLSAYESDAWRPVKGSQQYFNIIKKHWSLVQPFLGKLPKGGFKEKCCAQFIVSRDRIKRRPRKLYELILEQMTDHKKRYGRAAHGKNDGWDMIHFWEAIWHYIMGEQAIVNTRKKYGYGIDINLENGRALSKRPERTLKEVIACPNS
ncbi:unnamed protein product [Bathycoccus prasinos]